MNERFKNKAFKSMELSLLETFKELNNDVKSVELNVFNKTIISMIIRFNKEKGFITLNVDTKYRTLKGFLMDVYIHLMVNDILPSDEDDFNYDFMIKFINHLMDQCETTEEFNELKKYLKKLNNHGDWVDMEK